METERDGSEDKGGTMRYVVSTVVLQKKMYRTRDKEGREV
jgi:hypothetical protein